MSRNAKITNYIFALVALYFGGASLIWGAHGAVVAVTLLLVGVLIALIWFGIYMIVDISNDY